MKKSLFSDSLLILVFVLTTLLFTQCKKYEEGPTVSLKSKKGRLANTWKIERKLINGKDVGLEENDQSYRLTLEKNGDAKELNEQVFLDEEGNGTWTLESNKEQLRIYVKFSADISRTTVYTIVRLKNNELWLQEKLNDGNVVEIHLTPAG